MEVGATVKARNTTIANPKIHANGFYKNGTMSVVTWASHSHADSINRSRVIYWNLGCIVLPVLLFLHSISFWDILKYYFVFKNKSHQFINIFIIFLLIY